MLALHAGSGVSMANSSESCRLWHHTAMPGPTARSSRREPLLPRSAPRALRFVSCSPATPLEDGFSLKLLSTTVSAWVPLSTSTFSSRRAHLSCSLSRSRMAVHPGVKMPKVLSCGRRIASGLSVGERAGTLPGTENVPACGARAYGGGPWDSIGEPRNAGTILLTES